MRKNLEYRWENSEFLKKYVPKVRFTDVRYEFENIDGKKLIVKSYGAKTGVRGAKEQGRRVDLAILDDLLSDDDARSPTIIKSIEDTVYKAIDYALHPTRSKVIWSGTPFNQNDPLYKAIESGGWYVNVYPVCEHFDASTTKETFVGAWGDRHDYKYVKSKYDKAIATGQIASFNQELMLRIMSDEDRLITDNDIVWYDRYSVLKYKSNYNFYITTDFATSEKTSADFSVISVWAYNNNGDWLYVDGVIKRQTMDKNLDDLFRFATMYKPDSVGIEVTGQQGGFIQWIREQQISRNIFFKLASEGNSGREGIRPNTNKMVRFNTVVPLFKAKKIWFPKDLENTQEMQEIMNELRNASTSGFKSKHDDFIDTVSMLSVMNPWKPSEALPIEYNESAQIWEEPTDYSDNSTIGSYIV
jgi:predicted phage terminase large subunit-like protein